MKIIIRIWAGWFILFTATIAGYVLSREANKPPIKTADTRDEKVTNVQLIDTMPVSDKKTRPGRSANIPPVLKEIASCESGGKHFDGNGRVLRGRENPLDIGRYQINLYHWGEVAQKLGHDLFDPEGNEKFAVWLYNNYGTWPWNPSKNCWNNALTAVAR
ncbi:hypothetical protein HYT01_03550 [Candidatus Giovannonibacteria bacterium]|nr:hypothetical protein [Candidatus Giovannonibacteria bacterium]